MMSPLRRSAADERGFTLVELMTSMALLSLVVTAVLGVMFSVQKAVSFEIKRSQTNDNVRLAMEAIDKEVRSANAFTVVGSDFVTAVAANTSGTYLSVYTQTNAPTRGVTNPDTTGFTCVQWRLSGTNMQSRIWPVNWREATTLLGPWVTRAESVQSLSFLIPSTGASDAYGKRLLRATMVVRVGSDASATVTTSREITGRNVLTTPTSTGEPNPCLTDPPPA